jgi:helicase
LKKENCPSGYWRFIFSKENIDEEINNCLNILKENRLIEEDSNGKLSLTPNGILIIAKRIKVETYLFFKTWLNYSRKGEISNLELLYLFSQTPDGKDLSIPFCHCSINDCKKERDNYEQEEVYGERILRLISEQNEEDKKLYQNNILLKKFKEDEVFSLEERLSFKKTLLLYDWIGGNKNVKTIEQEYKLHRGAIYRLGEGFSWLADSLAAIAENAGWKKGRKEDLNQIKLLSNRLIEGVKEEGLNLANLYIPGLSRYHIRRLVGAGYNNKRCLEKLSEEDLSKILPDILAKRIKRRFSGESGKVKERGLQDDSQQLTTNPSRTSQLKTENRELKTVLQIDIHRPDRIIFEGRKVKVTAKEFSLIHLLAQNRGKIITHNDLLETIWKESKYATYVQITFHLSKIRRAVLKTICYNKRNRKKIKNIFKVISRRGIMLNLAEDKLKIS